MTPPGDNPFRPKSGVEKPPPPATDADGMQDKVCPFLGTVMVPDPDGAGKVLRGPVPMVPMLPMSRKCQGDVCMFWDPAGHTCVLRSAAVAMTRSAPVGAPGV